MLPRLQKSLNRCNLGAIFRTLATFPGMGLTLPAAQNSPVLFPGIIISVSRHHVCIGYRQRRLADQSSHTISEPQFSHHHHVGLSQERIKTIPNGIIIIQKINCGRLFHLSSIKVQKALKTKENNTDDDAIQDKWGDLGTLHSGSIISFIIFKYLRQAAGVMRLIPSF